MNNPQRAAILFGCLPLDVSRRYFELMNYTEKKQLLESIVHLPLCSEETTKEIVWQCLDLIQGTTGESDDYKEHLHQLAKQKEKSFLMYIRSLIQSERISH